MKIPEHLRRKRFWNVADFAEFAGLTHKVAKARLKTYNEQMNGMLLTPSRGTNREYTFLPSRLSRAIPDMFEPIDSVEFRVNDLEDKIEKMHHAQRIVAVQTGANTNEIERLKRKRAA